MSIGWRLSQRRLGGEWSKGRLLPRCRTARALGIVDPSADPYEGLRRHEPRPGELDEFGLDGTDALVRAVNAELAARRRGPIGPGEFPTNRAGYERMRRLLRSLRARGGTPSPDGGEEAA